MLCLHACFRFCPSDAPPPFPAHNPPAPPRGPPPFPYLSHLNLNHASMQRILSDVESQRGCYSKPLPCPAPHGPRFTIYLQAYISEFALSPLFGLQECHHAAVGDRCTQCCSLMTVDLCWSKEVMDGVATGSLGPVGGIKSVSC